MAENVTYQEIHSYMLQKTREYYQDPPAELVDAVMAQREQQGSPVTREEAKGLVSLIDIQRCLKEEMTRKWPEFMSTIPGNSLRDR